MQYFSNGHERSVFRDKARVQLDWYKQKVIAYQGMLLSDPRKFNFSDYMMYVRECSVLEDYIAALDVEDESEGIIGNRDLPREVPHTNVQREAVLSRVVGDLVNRLDSIRDSIGYLESSGMLADVHAADIFGDIKGACDVSDSDITRADGYGYRVVPSDSPMMAEWGSIQGDRDQIELMCMLYDINYNISGSAIRSAMEVEARKWYQAIRAAIV